MIALLFGLLFILYVIYQYKIYRGYFKDNYKSMILAIFIELPGHVLSILGILFIAVLLNVILQ